MGLMTRDEMESDLQVATGNRNDVIATSARRVRTLNQAYRYVCMPNIYRHRELQESAAITLVAAQDVYDSTDGVPSDLWAVHNLVNVTRGLKLHPRSIRQLDDELIRDGEPQVYALWGHDGTSPEIILRDRPTATYASDTLRLRYWQRPGEFADGNATTVIVPEFDPIIIEGAKWLMENTHLNSIERAEIARQVFAALVNDVTDPMQVEGEDTGAAVEVIVDDPMYPSI